MSIGYIGDPRAGRVIRHYQFVNWYVDVYAPRLSAPHLFTVRETRDTRVQILCENRTVKEAFRIYFEHIEKMSRQAGLECQHPSRHMLEYK